MVFFYCHYFIISLCNRFIMSVFRYVIVSFHCFIVSPFYYLILSLFHYLIILLFNSFIISFFRGFIISLFHISLLHCFCGCVFQTRPGRVLHVCFVGATWWLLIVPQPTIKTGSCICYSFYKKELFKKNL